MRMASAKSGFNTDTAEHGAIPNAQYNAPAKAAELTAATVGISIFGVFLIATTAVAFLISFAAPLAVTGSGLVVSSVIRHEWKTSIHHLNNTHDVDVFVRKVNIYEDTVNLSLFVMNFVITLFDYCLGLLYLLFLLVVNIMVFCFKFILTQPFVIDTIQWAAQLAATVADNLSGAFGAMNAVTPPTSEYGADPGEVFGAAPMDFGSASTRYAWVTRLWQFLNSIGPFFTSLDDRAWGELVNWIGDPLLKNLPEIFKMIANIGSLTSKAGAWSRYFGNDILLKQTNSLLQSSDCFGAALVREAICGVQTSLTKAITDIVNAIPGVHVSLPSCSIPKFSCQIPSKSFGAGQGAAASEGFGAAVPGAENTTIFQDFGAFFGDVFGAGRCDEVECEFFVEDLLGNFIQLPNNTCAYWVYSPTAVYDCMVLVDAYANINNTAQSKANPDTLAAEMCFVFLAKNLASCQSTGQVFQFDFPGAAVDVCSNTQYGASFSACSCQFQAPLCDAGCCGLYADHVSQQVLGQIPDRTCAELYTYFPKTLAWCPLLDVNPNVTIVPFNDNTYASMWCGFFIDVLDPLCSASAPFTQLRDLPIAGAVFQIYTDRACNATVNQVGVCMPVNTTVDDLAFALMGVSDSETRASVFEANDALAFVRAPIPTVFTLADDATTIRAKDLQKHYCQQFSEVYKNDNLVLRSQPWSVASTASVACDNGVMAAAFDVSLSTTTFYKYEDAQGFPIGVDVAGLPDGLSAFGSAANPNTQIDGVCVGDVGGNVNEMGNQDACVEQLRQKAYDSTGLTTETGMATLAVFAAQEQYTDSFISSSGYSPIDPADPLAAQKQVELDRTNAALAANLEFTVTPFDEIANITPEWRTDFVSPPSDNSDQSNNPAFFVTGETGTAAARIILSIDTGLPEAPDYYADVFNLLVRGKAVDMATAVRAAVAIPTQSRADYAAEAKFKKRLVRLGDRIHRDVYLKRKEQYEAQGHDIDNVDHFPRTRELLTTHGRHLLMTGIPAEDARISEILDILANVVHNPIGITQQEFYQFLQNDIVAKMGEVAVAAGTIVLPNVFLAMFQFANADFPLNASAFFDNLTVSDQQVFGETGNNAPCHPTIKSPYKCCKAATNAYDCCKGLIGCFPLIPGTLFLTRTTPDNFERWNCTDVSTFWGWLRWFFTVLLSGIASVVKSTGGSIGVALSPVLDRFIVPTGSLPDNLFSCLLVNQFYGWLAIAIVFGIYFFVSVQVFTLLILLVTNFRQRQAQDDQQMRQSYESRLSKLRARRDAVPSDIRGITSVDRE